MSKNKDKELFLQSVPVFSAFAPRILRFVDLADKDSTLLDTRLVADTFTAGEHFVVAQGFVLRTIFPVLGRATPELTTEEPTAAGLNQRHTEVMAVLQSLTPEDFSAAAERVVSHVAGDAEITQTSSDYIRLFALPNFFFHFTMGYATLRSIGVKIGKADFDGLHSYATEFSFVS